MLNNCKCLCSCLTKLEICRTFHFSLCLPVSSLLWMWDWVQILPMPGVKTGVIKGEIPQLHWEWWMLLGAVTNVNISKSKPSYRHLLYSVYLPSITKIIFSRAVHPKAYSFAPSEGYFFFPAERFNGWMEKVPSCSMHLPGCWVWWQSCISSSPEVHDKGTAVARVCCKVPNGS